MAPTTENQTQELRTPDHLAWHVTERSDKSYWNKVGAAWSHKDNKGFTLQLESLPVGGRIVLRQPLEYKSETPNDTGRT